jgi:hypothetical protein
MGGGRGMEGKRAGMAERYGADVETVLLRRAESDSGGRLSVVAGPLKPKQKPFWWPFAAQPLQPGEMGRGTKVTVEVAALGLSEAEEVAVGVLGTSGGKLAFFTVTLLALMTLWIEAGAGMYTRWSTGLVPYLLFQVAGSVVFTALAEWLVYLDVSAALFGWKRLSATLILDPAALTVTLRRPGADGPSSTTLHSDEALAPRPVAAEGWAGVLGVADVAVGLRGGGERRLGLVVGRGEAEWIASLVAAMWRGDGSDGGDRRSQQWPSAGERPLAGLRKSMAAFVGKRSASKWFLTFCLVCSFLLHLARILADIRGR